MKIRVSFSYDKKFRAIPAFIYNMIDSILTERRLTISFIFPPAYSLKQEVLSKRKRGTGNG